MGKIMYFAVDVDDKNFHACGISEGAKSSETILKFKTRPNPAALSKKLKEATDQGFDIKVCYEALYIGFSLYRDLVDRGINCDVIAPSSVPRTTGQVVKTDRVDAEKMARYYKQELLTVVHVPTKDIEQVRMLCRSRHFMARQVRDLKRHIVSTCRKIGLNYRADSKFKCPAYFTQMHLDWLKNQLTKEEFKYSALSMEMMISQLNLFESQIKEFDGEIEKHAQKPEYKKKVEALNCYRGLDTLSSMTIIAEIGDINRFAHPSKLTSYVGFDLREYSSGGRERKFSISKMGNSRLRWTIVEACQRVHRTPNVSSRLRTRRKKADVKSIEIADRCMKRLYKKSQRMILGGKPVNKAKVACAREMLGFVWESLRHAS